jgi:hypothetical protein
MADLVALSNNRSLVQPHTDKVQDALVTTDTVVFGVVPMENMDPTMNPSRHRLEPAPEAPTVPMPWLRSFWAVLRRKQKAVIIFMDVNPVST